MYLTVNETWPDIRLADLDPSLSPCEWYYRAVALMDARSEAEKYARQKAERDAKMKRR